MNQEAAEFEADPARIDILRAQLFEPVDGEGGAGRAGKRTVLDHLDRRVGVADQIAAFGGEPDDDET